MSSSQNDNRPYARGIPKRLAWLVACWAAFVSGVFFVSELNHPMFEEVSLDGRPSIELTSAPSGVRFEVRNASLESVRFKTQGGLFAISVGESERYFSIGTNLAPNQAKAWQEKSSVIIELPNSKHQPSKEN